MHVAIELKDVESPNGPTIELKVNILEEVNENDLEKEATPVMYATNVIVGLFQNGDIKTLVDDLKAQIAASNEGETATES